MTLEIQRRSFITGALSTLFLAPAIVHANNLMPVKLMVPSPYEIIKPYVNTVFTEPTIHFPTDLINFNGFVKQIRTTNGFITGADILIPNSRSWETSYVSIDQLKLMGFESKMSKDFMPYLQHGDYYYEPNRIFTVTGLTVNSPALKRTLINDNIT